MNIVRHTIPVTTDASGDFTTTKRMAGLFLQLRYIPDGSSPLDTGADLDIVEDDTGIVVANHDDIGTSAFTRVYRQLISAIDGTESTTVYDYIALSGQTTLTIANGGNTLSGTFYIYMGN